MRTSTLLAVSAAVRLALVVWGVLQDRLSPVPYTDVDYIVFTDAARFVAQGVSPYMRSTYRYSPLLAYMLLPNVWVHPVWGKLLFSAADIWVGHAIAGLVRRLGGDASAGMLAAAAWLYNPYTLTISTRGSCDVLVVALLLSMLKALLDGDAMWAAALYGLAVHLRVYPIIYAPSLVLFLAARSLHKMVARRAMVSGQREPKPAGVPLPGAAGALHVWLTHVSLHGIIFGALSGSVFLLLGVAFWRLYGDEFLREAFLHHLGRKDPRHNFSIYFYSIYLTYFAPREPSGGSGGNDATLARGSLTGSPAGMQQATAVQLDPVSELVGQLGPWLNRLSEPAVLAFVPQLVLLLAVSLRLHADLPLCWLVLTMAFVAFNKVCTAQYFVWWLCLLPLVLHHVPRPVPPLLWVAAGAWVGAQLHWLAWAYLLEFQGLPVYLPLWAAGLVFLATNVFLLAQLLSCVRPAQSFLAHSLGYVAPPAAQGGATAAAQGEVAAASEPAEAATGQDVSQGAATLRQRRGRPAEG